MNKEEPAGTGGEKKITYVKVCPTCHNLFYAPHEWQRYCSVACRRKARLDKERKERAEKSLREVVCETCGKVFEARHPHARFCSRECMAEARRKLRERSEIVKTCVVCGKEFKTVYARHVCCSPECSDARAKRYDKHPEKVKKCKICGKEFKTRKPNQVCCSPECSRKNNKSRVGLPDFVKKCAVCGKEFTTRKPNQVVCSDACRYEWRCNTDKRHKHLAEKLPPPVTEDGKMILSCTVCGTLLPAGTRPPTCTCSDECKKKYAMQYKSLNKIDPTRKHDHKRFCVVCGKLFKPESSTDKTCSDECRQRLLDKFHGIEYFFPTKKRQEERRKNHDPERLSQRAREAEICGMSYGNYSARLRMGKTFEQLRPPDWKERLAKIENRQAQCNTDKQGSLTSVFTDGRKL